MLCFCPCCSALLKLLHESVGNGGGSKFTELVMKCNWKAIRILPSRTNDLDLDQILLDAHNFLVVSSVTFCLYHGFTIHLLFVCFCFLFPLYEVIRWKVVTTWYWRSLRSYFFHDFFLITSSVYPRFTVHLFFVCFWFLFTLYEVIRGKGWRHDWRRLLGSYIS